MNSQLSDLDRKMLKLLLDSRGAMTTKQIASKLKIPATSVQKRRKRLEDGFIIDHYSLDPTKFGWRKIDLLIYTEGGETIEIGKQLLKREEVTYAARTIGEQTIDLRIKVFVKDNWVLLNLLEDIKAMQGVRNVVWTEVVEVIGRKNPPKHIEL